MTTTLRPIGPLQQGADGAKARAFDVCVNSRPVGAVELATDTDFGAAWARISGLRIHEPDRRRGRGTVAALAAEEVLRGWRCTHVRAAVPAGADAALRMADSLGYTETNRTMLKRLPARPPVLPEGAESRAMTDEEFRAWNERAIVAYAQTWIDRGVPEAQARVKAAADHNGILPEGRHTPGVSIKVLVSGGEVVGHIWTSRAPGRAGRFVYDVEVGEQHRGHGHGRTLMLVAERDAVAAGERELGLNVFAGNTPAVRLYTSLGYEPTVHHFHKQLL
ncbi:GNAT family N-acetyltransferase [Streptomyces beijiangensis]|uniref:GNAT family N-acetyltransferase n=1 Tax=Streptomyces beijiangensis TaxID=163361 RepID=A0A939F9P8_9ACTN|nr:GNAT family N-acetyltransferase [Streptomyces beijiangensis]MBO0514316.1 GNAT family N-acetyltransferase [Streptomyces beijiangensis]